MPAPDHPTDPSGFRVPQRFDDHRAAAPSPGRYQRQLRWIVSIILTLVVGAMLFRSQLADTGRRAMADYYLTRAQPHLIKEDYGAALSEVDQAIQWYDKAIEPYLLRSEVHSKLKQLDAAAEDLTTALEKTLPKEESQRVTLLMQRSVIYQRQNKQTEALDDLEQAYEIRSAKNSQLLNHRAYARAVFNVELKGALKDIEQAIEWASSAPIAAYIDTRGYVYFRLGRYDEALKDIEQAIQLTQTDRAFDEERCIKLGLPAHIQKQVLERHDRDLAVMFHHRGEIHEKLGNKDEAEMDLKKAIEMGYDREAGVF